MRNSSSNPAAHEDADVDDADDAIFASVNLNALVQSAAVSSSLSSSSSVAPTRSPHPSAAASSFSENFGFLQSPTTATATTATATTSASSSTGRVLPKATSRPYSSGSIVVNPNQRHNNVLKHVQNVVYEFDSIVPDFVLGKTTCALFLSLRYHNLHPEYIYQRMRGLDRLYNLRVLLILVDIKDTQQTLRELTRISFRFNFTIMLAWSEEEAARYLETYKAYENRSADPLKERVDTDYLSKLTDVLTSIKSVNKTDVVTLISTFGSLKNIAKASSEDLLKCPGIGEQKVRRIQEVFNEPFLPEERRRRRQDQDAQSTNPSKASPGTADQNPTPMSLVSPAPPLIAPTAPTAPVDPNAPKIGLFRLKPSALQTSTHTAKQAKGAIVPDWRAHLNSNAGASDDHRL